MIRILKTGTELSIHDLGRPHLRRYGIPLSGVMDTASAIRSNHLVGNPSDSAVLECYLPGHRLLFESDHDIALTGARANVRLNDKIVRMDTRLEVSQGDVLSIDQMHDGCRLYVAVGGGISSSLVFGSQSGLNGILNSRLSKNDRVHIHPLQNQVNQYSRIRPVPINTAQQLNVFRAPEFDWLTDTLIEHLFEQVFQITPESNRMGYRLSGVALPIGDNKHMISSPVFPGTVQLLPDGHLIILMRDCQTIGGYPRILQLSEASINCLAQRRPGQGVSFQLIE